MESFYFSRERLLRAGSHLVYWWSVSFNAGVIACASCYQPINWHGLWIVRSVCLL